MRTSQLGLTSGPANGGTSVDLIRRCAGWHGQRAGYVAINHDTIRQSLPRLHRQAQDGLGIQEVGRTSTHPVRSRSQSLGVIGCRFVFRTGRVISPIQNPAYAPSSAHTRRIEFSFLEKYVVRGNDHGTAGRKSSGGRRPTVSLSSKNQFAPRLGQHAEGAIGMEHSIDAFCVLLVSAIERTPQSAAAQALQA